MLMLLVFLWMERFSSNHSFEHKLAAFNFYINRILTLPIKKQAKQQEWKIILAMAQNNGFPLHIIHNLKKKLTAKKQYSQLQQNNKQINIYIYIYVTFLYHSTLIRKINTLFKHTKLNIALRAANTIHLQLTDKIFKTSPNSSGIYKLKCYTCNSSCVGQ